MAEDRAARLEQARARARALAGADYSSPARECDMVMKGGITSGVVYPLAACELAKTYRFRNLGGASAGAIAAAATAAAEKGRDKDGFAKLAALPDEIGTTLASLFQPSAGTRPLFRVLMAAIHPTRTGVRKALGIVAAAVTARPLAFAIGVTLVLGPAVGALALGGGLDAAVAWLPLVVGALVAILLGLVFVAVALVRLGVRVLGENFYGICIGSRGPAQDQAGPPPLTDWLTEKIDDIAGVAGPLTFGDLWGEDAPGEAVAGTRGARRINLEMMTTNVTHGRPSRLPFETRVYLFCPVELERVFPPKVMRRMRVAGPAAAKDGRVWGCPDHDVDLFRVPEPRDVPVVVAARMSLSFPLLISAVPLFAIDYSRTPQKVGPVRCWFSDGGIASNFPIHFFDGLWPSRPTFGISLAPYHEDFPEYDSYYPGAGTRGKPPRVRATGTFTGFLAAIADTMQNWSDEGQSGLPGYRDRIVEIHHTDDEGGMNLSMPPDVIALLAERGREAAETLGSEFDFKQHRWTRYLTSMSKLSQALQAMRRYWGAALPDGTSSYEDLIVRYGPAAAHYRKTQAWATGAAEVSGALVGSLDDDVDLVANAPRPDPDLRITPHF